MGNGLKCCSNKKIYKENDIWPSDISGFSTCGKFV